MKVHVITVHLANKEYGSQIMLQVAADTFAKNKGLQLSADKTADGQDTEKVCVVKVYEHGGWWLQYAMMPDDGRIVVVGTANDVACFPPEIQQLRDNLKRAEFVYEPEIWREAA
jgi:hypothetical protein